ncbi:hypothetical protein PBI_TEAMOCIL_4 [Microbacterium phage Teamocil]|uniref:Uncharacterized protein n=1 Tax=Microbacterium phage Teamocil TaxID=2656554 RepID=A0A649VWS6_9CAUD|nr:hypothetical protein QDA12_gp04 [Microbacterium phage Teamocil]QGJ88859.1 hypothetical protein PBI_GINA_4 [Microbacterium phage Gina]QGJ96956.1 hypothetical protein PBI_TEAMOCIL_4 [Microbacterium phage Teamocil]
MHDRIIEPPLPDLPAGESIGPRILFGDEQAAPGSDDR